MYAAPRMNVALFLFTLSVSAGRPLAVLPVTAVNASAGDIADLASVDDAIRNAAARDDVQLQQKETTMAAVAAARKAGVECGVADVACVKKLAALDEVELVIVPVATPRKDGSFAVALTLLEVTGPRAPERALDALTPHGKDLGERAKKLVDTLFEKWREPAVESPDTIDLADPSASPSTTTPTTTTTTTATATTSTTPSQP